MLATTPRAPAASATSTIFVPDFMAMRPSLRPGRAPHAFGERRGLFEADRPQPAALLRRAVEEQRRRRPDAAEALHPRLRSEEHTSELQSLMRNLYAVFCLTKTISTNMTAIKTTQGR